MMTIWDLNAFKDVLIRYWRLITGVLLGMYEADVRKAVNYSATKEKIVDFLRKEMPSPMHIELLLKEAISKKWIEKRSSRYALGKTAQKEFLEYHKKFDDDIDVDEILRDVEKRSAAAKKAHVTMKAKEELRSRDKKRLISVGFPISDCFSPIKKKKAMMEKDLSEDTPDYLEDTEDSLAKVKKVKDSLSKIKEIEEKVRKSRWLKIPKIVDAKIGDEDDPSEMGEITSDKIYDQMKLKHVDGSLQKDQYAILVDTENNETLVIKRFPIFNDSNTILLNDHNSIVRNMDADGDYYYTHINKDIMEIISAHEAANIFTEYLWKKIQKKTELTEK